MQFECRCTDPEGMRIKVSSGRVMLICDSCKGIRYEAYSRPVTCVRVLRRVVVDGHIKIITIHQSIAA